MLNRFKYLRISAIELLLMLAMALILFSYIAPPLVSMYRHH